MVLPSGWSSANDAALRVCRYLARPQSRPSKDSPAMAAFLALAAALRCALTASGNACYKPLVPLFAPYRSALMADLKKQFEDAAKKALNLKDRPDNDTMLKLYALYKQGAQGDVSGEKPGFFDFVGVAKYEAWAKLKGTAAEAAQKQYVDLVKKLAG
jgi:acyl-CoA-binding protein